MEIRTVSGEELVAAIPALARLRMTVFRDYPYLYDGSEAYEAEYLRAYSASGTAMAVLAREGEAIVGASTGIPLAHETAAFREPFARLGLDAARIFYCGESVLLPAYRGRGIYRAFFQGREDWARMLGGFTQICFCAVERPADHPLRPRDYVPLDAAWRHFGYAPEPGLTMQLAWKDIDRDAVTEHTMRFWFKALAA
jgi:GNAT superfamily N-acetyltransferase